MLITSVVTMIVAAPEVHILFITKPSTIVFSHVKKKVSRSKFQVTRNKKKGNTIFHLGAEFHIVNPTSIKQLKKKNVGLISFINTCICYQYNSYLPFSLKQQVTF